MWLELLGALATQALLDLFDPGLERNHVLLQLCEGALEDLAPAALVGEPCLDPAESLGDRLVLLLEPLESVIDRIDVAEHLLSQLGEPDVRLVESAVHLVEPVVHPAEPTIDLGEVALQGFDELLVFDGGHGPYLSQVQTERKCVRVWTGPGSSGLLTCQQERSPGLAWLHGIVHTLEGDLDNARYRYRRAGRDFPGRGAVQQEIEAARRKVRR